MTLIPLARPTIGDPELEAQARALRSRRLVLGPENAGFEAELQAATGATFAVAVASGTAALHAALWALDLAPGEVIVPAFTFPAPANVAAALGHEVVPVDVDERTWNLDPEAAARAVTARTRAIVAVDQFGLPADHERLAALGVPLVEDAACALGAPLALGRARAACLSFHPRKIITTGEGGAVLCADGELAERARRLRHHGQRAPGDFDRVGLNLRMPESCAAVGRAQLRRLPELLAARRRLVARYRQAIELPTQAPAETHAWQTFAVVLPERADRARVIARLREREIEAGPATYALHRIGGGGRFRARGPLPIADRLHDRALALPLYAEMTDDDVDRVVRALHEALA